MVVGLRNGIVVRLESSHGLLQGTVQDFDEQAKAMSFSPDGSLLAISYGNVRGWSKRLTLVDTADWSVLHRFEDFSVGIPVWSPNSERLAFEIYTSAAIIIPRTGEAVLAAEGPDQIMRTAWIDNDTLFLQRAGHFQTWDASTQTLKAEIVERRFVNDAKVYKRTGYFAASDTILSWDVDTETVEQSFGDAVDAS